MLSVICTKQPLVFSELRSD